MNEIDIMKAIAFIWMLNILDCIVSSAHVSADMMTWFLENPVSLAYTSAIMDVYWTVRKTIVGGALISAVYFYAIVLGFYIGDIVNQMLEPFLSVALIRVPFPADVIIEYAITIVVFIVAIALCLFCARQFIRLLVAAAYGLGKMGSVWFFVALGAISLSGGIIAAIAPGIVQEEFLELVTGVGILAALIFLFLGLWLYLRYHPNLMQKARIFDFETGAGLYQLQELRKLKLRADF